MEISKPHSARADWFAIACSVGCAIHCAATPILLAFLPTLTSVRWLADPLFHQSIAVVCGILVVLAIWPGYRDHGSRPMVAAALIGLGLLFVAAFVLPDRCCSVHETSPELKSTALIAPSADTETTSDRLSATTSRVDSSVSQHLNVPTKLVSTVLLSNSSDISHESTPKESAPSCECCHDHEDGDTSPPSTGNVCCSTSNSCHHATVGKVLFEEAELEQALGPKIGATVVSSQPFLSPIGGVFLVLAHLLNIRGRSCRKRCCSHA